MKKYLAMILALTMVLGLVACGGSSAPAATEAPAAQAPAAEAGPAPAVAGAVWYQFADTFISNTRAVLEGKAAESGWLTVNAADSKFDVPTQMNNINMFYTQGVDYLLINNFDANSTSALVEQAKEEGKTIIFVNCNSPSEEDFASYENVWHISSLADQSGTIMGQQVTEYWKAHPEADRNGNGKLDYVMLIGMVEHYDSLARRDYSIQAVQDAGIETNEIYQAICGYSRAEAMNTVQSLLAANADDIEAVFAANDDMALGAIEALTAAGFFGDGEFIPVVGVDATAVGCEAIKEGTLLGTSLNSSKALGELAYGLVYCLQAGLEVTPENLGCDASFNIDGHNIWIDYIAITADNLADAGY